MPFKIKRKSSITQKLNYFNKKIQAVQDVIDLNAILPLFFLKADTVLIGMLMFSNLYLI